MSPLYALIALWRNMERMGAELVWIADYLNIWISICIIIVIFIQFWIMAGF